MPRYALLDLVPVVEGGSVAGALAAAFAPIILDAALNTVKKHVQNILVKLGVETRLAAALRATEILGLPGVDAARFRAD